jgi:hypothetical protein
MAGAFGAAVALLAVAPLLVPVALLALIPGWLASGRRGRARRISVRQMRGMAAADLASAAAIAGILWLAVSHHLALSAAAAGAAALVLLRQRLAFAELAPPRPEPREGGGTGA